MSVDGQKLSIKDDGELTRIEVDLDVDLFGKCELVFNDPKLDLINGTRFKSGTFVKVEMGFAHKLSKVFEGEVVSLEPRFVRDLPPALHVVCQESIHRLGLSPHTRALNDVDDKQIVTKIAREHGLSAQAPTGTKGHHLQANVTDAVFLRRMAQKHGNHLRIEGKKLIVGPPPKGAQVILGPGSGIQKLKLKLKSLAQVGEVTIHGWDPKAKQEIVGKAKPPPGLTGDGAKKYGKGTLSFAGHEHAAADTASADAMAKGRLLKIAEGFATAQVDVIGDVRIVPGASVEIEKMGGAVEGIYRVEKAVHRFSKHGYWVSLRGVRTSKQTTSQKAAQKAQQQAQQRAQQQAAKALKQQHTSQTPAQPQAPVVEEAITLAGVIQGPKGPLKNWPFRLLRDGARISKQDLGAATTENEFKSGAWRSNTGGRYRFEGLRKGSWKIEVLLASATAVEEKEEAAAKESGHRSAQAEPEAARDLSHLSLEPEKPSATPSATAAFEAAHFETDKALPLPGSIPVFRALASFLAANPGRTVLVVGHTDAVGSAAHNLVLSGDRAQAVAAYLRDDAAAWMRFYGHPAASSTWGTREDQLMLSAVPHDATPWYGGAIDGIDGNQTRAAFRRLQQKHGLSESGKADDQTRRALILEYMGAEDTSIGEEPQILACGERHLLEDTQEASGVNRRVDVFAFESKDIQPAPEECRSGKHPGCDVYERWKDAAQPLPPPDVEQVVEGILKFQDGMPAAGVPLILELPDGTKKGAVTNPAGRYRIAAAAGGQLRLADGLPLAAEPDAEGALVVAVNGSGGGSSSGVA